MEKKKFENLRKRTFVALLAQFDLFEGNPRLSVKDLDACARLCAAKSDCVGKDIK